MVRVVFEMSVEIEAGFMTGKWLEESATSRCILVIFGWL